MTPFKPSLVAPGGSLEKAKIALTYGADSVYVGGPDFGLRKSADNLSFNQLEHLVDFANSLGKSIYVTLNGFGHNEDIAKLPEFVTKLQKASPHALIISDVGVCQIAKDYSSIAIHTSTQASVSHSHAALLWKSFGVKRVVVARECSLEECRIIKEESGLEIEAFVHGAMCVSYSGKCVISNYTAGRDSNRGGCVQSCRHNYNLFDAATGEEDLGNTHIMNAKDLRAISMIPSICDNQIDALKIEGRMKSNLYVANTVALYRDAIDQAVEAQSTNQSTLNTQESILERVSNRGFCTGSLDQKAEQNSITREWNGYNKQVQYLGTVKECTEDGHYTIEVKSPLKTGDTVEILKPDGSRVHWPITAMTNALGDSIDTAHASTIVQIKGPSYAPRYSILQRGLE